MNSPTSQIFAVLKEANRLDLYEKIAEAWEKNSALRDEVDSLKETVNQLQNEKHIASRLMRDNEKQWLTLKDDDDSTARYCTFCWDDTKKLIRLRPGWHEGECKKCQSSYGESYQPEQSTYEGFTFEV